MKAGSALVQGAAAPALRRWGRQGAVYGPLPVLGLLMPLLVLLALGLGLPLAGAVWGSLAGTDGFGESYISLMNDPLFWTVLLRTITTAAEVSLISVVVGYPTAEFIARSSAKVRPILLAIVIIPLLSSVIARTYAWYGVFVRDGVVDRIAGLFGLPPQRLLYTQTAVMVGMVYILLPLVILPIYATLRGYDERLTLASSSLGAGHLRTLVMVKLPILAPVILAAGTGVYILALGFFVTPALLGGPTSQLVSNLISQQVFQTFNLPHAQAMSMALLLVTLSSLALGSTALLLMRRRLQ